MAGGAAAAFGSVVDGVLGWFSNEETNRVNKQIARENREWQTVENNKQRAWEVEQKEVERAYNSPGAAMGRYRAAGLNPFLQQTSIGPGETQAPSAPSPQGAPNMPTMISPYQGNSISRAFELAMQKQSVDANSANQQAQSLTELAEAAQKLAETFGTDKAKQIVEPYLKSVNGLDYESGKFWSNVENKAREYAANAELAEVNASLEKEFGKAKYQKVLAKMDYDFVESVSRVGVMHTVTELNHSLIAVNKAKVDEVVASTRELLARSLLHFLQGGYYKQLGLTEKQARKWYVSKLRAEAGSTNLDFIDVFYDWLENGDIRNWKASDKAQEQALENYKTNTNSTWNVIDRGANTVGKVAKGAEPFVKKRSVTTHVNE